jgi:ABC-type transport system substrate-binding protein
MFRLAFALVVAAAILAACAPPATPSAGVERAPAAPSPPRSITMGVRYELISGQSKALNNSSSEIQKRLLNASLAMMDSQGAIYPYLAETLPQLQTASWQVFDDGRMETTYLLRRNLTWHDGSPLTADDFAFAYRI